MKQTQRAYKIMMISQIFSSVFWMSPGMGYLPPFLAPIPGHLSNPFVPMHAENLTFGPA